VGQFYEWALMKDLPLRLMASLNFISAFIVLERMRPTDRNSFAGVFSLADCYTNLGGK